MPPRSTRSALSLAMAAALAAQALAAPAALAAAAGAPELEVKVGTAGAFSRIELHGGRPTLRREGDEVVARFARGAAPDIARLHIAPPPHLASVTLSRAGGGVELRFTPARDSEARWGVADGASWINFAPKPQPPVPSPTVPAGDPAPADGVVRMGARMQGGALVLSFPWRAPLGAAVFRRGPAVWVVFDGRARLDLSAAPHGFSQAKSFVAASSGDFTALRIETGPGVMPRAELQGAVWTVALGPQALGPNSVELEREGGPRASLQARLPDATRAGWIADPAVGDRLAVVTATGPSAGVTSPRGFVEGEILRSVQGLAAVAAVDDLSVSLEGGLVRIGRPRGLQLSGSDGPAPAQVDAVAAPPGPSSLPAVVDPAWARTGEGGFVRRYDDLLAGAAREMAAGRDAGPDARLGLARYLTASGLAFEAIGVLDSLLKASPALAQDAGFRGLRGAARAMAGRCKDAQADFSTAATAGDPSSALWRGYCDAQAGDVAGARQEFAHGREAIAMFDPAWRARFARADAETALASGDVAGARIALDGAGEGAPADEAAGLQLARGRLAEAAGDMGAASAFYLAASQAHDGGIAAPARLAALRLQLAQRRIAPAQAAAELDALRFLWRGDATEIDVIRELGTLDIAQGRYREALEAMRSAGSRLPDLPSSVALREELTSAFRALFLEGRADGMEPVQQLALFYDFKELTPIGADGDLMVRRLVKRMVDVDLLDQAAELLRYQVDNRLQGVAKAQVATDLAAIALMAGRAEDAVNAIESSRTTLLPTALTAQRRLIEARALVMLGRFDHALELVGTDGSADAQEIRAEAGWKARDWPAAGRWAEARLGDRWRSAAPLAPAETTLLVRAACAYSLANDATSLARLRERWGALAAANAQRDALAVAMAAPGAPAGGAAVAVARSQIGDADLLAGWIARMKAQLSDVGSTTVAAASPPSGSPAPSRRPAPARRA